jgi:flagellar secretion chaperone FliS
MSASFDVSRIYQRSAVQGATPIELVVLLYESAIQDLGRALAAMQARDVERRTREVGHALIVLQQLQGTLDFERGGSAARQFEQFYNLVRAKVLEAQMRGSPEVMREQLRYLSEVRDCWLQAKGQLQAQSGPPPVTNSKAPGAVRSEWQA